MFKGISQFQDLEFGAKFMSKVCCIQYGVVMICGKVDGSPVDLAGCTGESKKNVTFLRVLHELTPMVFFVNISMLDDIGWRERDFLKRISNTLGVFYHFLIAAVQLRSRLFQ
jgi:hypothetical protein